MLRAWQTRQKARRSVTKSEEVNLVQGDTAFFLSLVLFLVSMIHQIFRYTDDYGRIFQLTCLILQGLPSLLAVFVLFVRFIKFNEKLTTSVTPVWIIWPIAALQTVVLAIIPLPLRADGSIAFVITGSRSELVTGTEWTYRLAVPFTVRVNQYEPLARVRVDSVTCKMEEVPVPPPAMCEVSSWTISLDVDLAEWPQPTVQISESALRTDLTTALCASLGESPVIQQLNRERVDVLRDSDAQSLVAQIAGALLKDRGITPNSIPRIRTYAVDQPPPQSCKTR